MKDTISELETRNRGARAAALPCPAAHRAPLLPTKSSLDFQSGRSWPLPLGLPRRRAAGFRGYSHLFALFKHTRNNNSLAARTAACSCGAVAGSATTPRPARLNHLCEHPADCGIAAGPSAKTSQPPGKHCSRNPIGNSMPGSCNNATRAILKNRLNAVKSWSSFRDTPGPHRAQGRQTNTQVYHDPDDHGWQFHYPGDKTTADAMIVALKEIYYHDPTVIEVADLPPGWTAIRGDVGGPWKREQN
jgi:hypothetical protein